VTASGSIAVAKSTGCGSFSSGPFFASAAYGLLSTLEAFYSGACLGLGEIDARFNTACLTFTQERTQMAKKAANTPKAAKPAGKAALNAAESQIGQRVTRKSTNTRAEIRNEYSQRQGRSK
jgi:hypothetical protein